MWDPCGASPLFTANFHEEWLHTPFPHIFLQFLGIFVLCFRSCRFLYRRYIFEKFAIRVVNAKRLEVPSLQLHELSTNHRYTVIEGETIPTGGILRCYKMRFCLL